MTNYCSLFRSDSKNIIVDKSLLNDNNIGFELKELISEYGLKQVGLESIDSNLQIIAWVYEFNNNCLESIEKFILEKNIEIKNVIIVKFYYKHNTQSISQEKYMVKKIDISTFYVSPIKYRHKIIAGNRKISYMERNTSFLNKICSKVIKKISRLFKLYSQKNNLNLEQCLEELAPEKIFTQYNEIDLKNCSNQRLSIIACLSGMKVLNSKLFLEEDSLKQNNRCIDINNKLKTSLTNTLINIS